MSRILHLSDVHFGAVDDRRAAEVLRLAADLQPDVTVISGDLTQRARPAQFAAARAFVGRLPGPVLLVPGNHDMPLFNLALRLAAPLAGYRRAFGPETEPRVQLPDAVLQGVNTANPHVWKAGRLRSASARRLAASFAAAPAGLYRVAVLHHAPVPAADGTPADMARPAAALAALAEAGTDIVLSGHTHMPHSGFAETAAGILFLQVGTAISTRLKTGANDFAVLTLDPGGVRLESWLAPAGQDFALAASARFERLASGWRRSGA